MRMDGSTQNMRSTRSIKVLGFWTFDPGFLILDLGIWLLEVGFLLSLGFWISNPRFWTLEFYRSWIWDFDALNYLGSRI